jgi:hypothetical protein
MIREWTRFRKIRIDANNVAPSTLLAWWHSRGAQSSTKVAEAHREMRTHLDPSLRGMFHRSRLLTAAKNVLNLVASRAGLGDTLVACLQKPAARG